MKQWLRIARERADIVSLVALGVIALAVAGAVPVGIYGVGIVAGSALALHAIGLVLVHRSNRIINFAQIPIALTAGLAFRLLIEQRTLLRAVRAVCGPCIERESVMAFQITYWLSLGLAIVAAIGVSWLIHATVAKRFANAPPLVLTVATVAVAQLLASLQSALPGLMSTQAQRDLSQVPQGVAAPPPIDASFTLTPAVFRTPDILIVVVAALAAAGLAAFFRYTRRGLNVQAAAENAERSSTLGIDVEATRGRVWLIAGALAGVAGVLSAMSSPSGPATAVDVALTVRVLGAAVIAAFTSLPVAMMAAVALGVFDQAMLWIFDSSAIADGLIALTVISVLLLQRTRKSRAETERAASWRGTAEIRPTPPQLRNLPEVRRRRRMAAGALLVVLVAVPFVMSPIQVASITTTLLYMMVGWSLLILSGWAGQISLGQFALAGAGAFTASIIAGRAGLPMPLAVVAGALTSAVLAGAAGVGALKLRGQHLAVTTLTVALVASSIVFNPSELGSVLPDTIRRPKLLGIDFENGPTFYFFTLLAAAAVAAGIVGLRRSRFGRALIASRDNEQAAQSFGIGVTRLRLTAFAISGLIAGFAGSVFAYQQHGLKAASFSPDIGIALFLMTVIGGLGSPAGPALGAAYLGVLSLVSAGPVVTFAATGGGLLILLAVAPGGLAEIAFGVRDTMLRRVARRHGIALGPVGMAQKRMAVTPGLAPSGGEAFVPRRYRLDEQWAAHPETTEPANG